MKTLKRNAAIILTVALLGIPLTGCQKNDITETYPAADISDIQIVTGGNKVVVRETTGTDIVLSLSDYGGSIGAVAGETLTVNIPMPNAGINLKSPGVLYVDIPKADIAKLQIESEAGDIELHQINVAYISAKTQYGGIVTKGLSASVEATTEIGVITSSVTMSNNIEEKKNYSGTIGDGNTSKHLDLYANVGNIEFE